MQVVLNVKGSSRTTESGHNREVVALYRWPLVLVPLYMICSVSVTTHFQNNISIIV